LTVVRKSWSSLLVGLALTAAWPTSVCAQETSENLVSELRAVSPQTPGLELEVVGGDRFLRLVNETGGTVVVEGYDDEPYLRFREDSRVEVNARSPSRYVNEDRFGRRPVPPVADSSAPPRWQKVADDGAYRWFDHRIHYMTPGTPEEVTDEARRTTIFDWTVPMTVGGRPVRAVGTLSWQPEEDSGSSPVPFIVAGAGLAALLGVALLLLRRRRRRPAAGGAADEAW